MKRHHTSEQLSELLCLCLNSACTMYKSFIEKKPVGMDTKSVASGLAPPFAGIIQAVSVNPSLHFFKLDFCFAVLNLLYGRI